MFYYLEERCKNLLCLSELSEKAKVFKIEKLKKQNSTIIVSYQTKLQTTMTYSFL